MEPTAEPVAKRQRKEPAWKSNFIDPSKLRDLKEPLPQPAPPLEDDATRHLAGGFSPLPAPGGGDDAEDQVVQTRLLDSNHVEITVLHKGRHYRGVVERTALPHGVGVTAGMTKEEMSSLRSAPIHGENPTNMCALCNKALDTPPIEDDEGGAYLKVRITTNWTARVHLQCAAWCPEVKEDPNFPGFYHFLGTAVRRGRALRCKACKDRGATVGCFQEGCPAVYHLSCAVNSGCAFDDSTLEVWCPSHLR